MVVVVHKEHGEKGVEERIIGELRTETIFVDMDASNIMEEFRNRPIV